MLGFVLSEKCNFRCRHCFNESEARKPAGMGADELLEHVRDAAATGRFAEIGLSGGEPMLFARALVRVVALAHELGLGANVTTNGYWGVSARTAHATLGPLVDAGLTALTVSVSEFHLEFTTGARLRTAVAAALGLGLEVRVNVVRTRAFDVADAAALLGPLADRVDVVAMPCIPVGRGAVAVSRDDLPAAVSPVGSCHAYFTRVAVTAEGDVYPCCSPGGFTPPLLMGNVRVETIGTVLARADDSFLLQVLDQLGPTFFLPFVHEALGRDLLAEGVVDQCHLCHRLLTDAALTAVVDDALATLEADLRALQVDLVDLREVARR
ncbi:radical SAM protein [Cellulomonas shaoxiangyii]|uniref:radical SAM protein n=1 Tax=Cellulomonas shaoxiangyii TaxID=2566013 RepID=UPI0014081B8F|nr:radical SAM protein [Cellulomonas shaoxiangyii]